MSFKYYPVPSPPASASSTLIDQFQALLVDQFAVATDVFTVSEEYVFASGSYVDIQVRITSAVDPDTNVRLGDDWKRILFKDINHTTGVGRKFYFSENTWITINSELIKSLTASATVRRCNNVLRWMLSDGTYASEPCVIDYKVNNPRDLIPQVDPVNPGGYMQVFTQLNSTTANIKSGQRFLFGRTDNWTCFKVLGSGNRNYNNIKTSDNTSAQLLTLEMQVEYVNNDTDNLILGIADYHKYSTSASSVSNIVVTPNDGAILESGSQVFDVHGYSGSTVLSGSFVFTVSGSSVPTDHYTFATIDNNTFSIINNEIFLDYPLTINCSGSSGSRTFDISLMGAW
jgi:hypothetical protein